MASLTLVDIIRRVDHGKKRRGRRKRPKKS